jgi:serine/threonine protein kinase
MYGSVKQVGNYAHKTPRHSEWLVPELERGALIRGLPDADIHFCAPFAIDSGVLVSSWGGTPIRNVRVTDPIGVCQHLIQGLLVLHSNGLIHGDINDSNIVISAEGVARYIDFWRPNKGRLSAWSSPEEVACGKNIVGPAVDCWRLGLVLQKYCLSPETEAVISNLMHVNPALRKL